MQFWKMNGAGNDFIVLNNLEEQLPAEEFPAIARTLCERHMSIGADGFMVVDAPTEGGDYKMLFFNSDGSIGEMCGNGARCICRYGYERGLAGEVQTVETTAGIVTGKRIDSRLYKIRLNDPTTIQLNAPVEVDGVTYDCAYVELGNPGLPHAVVPYHNLRNADENELRELGRKIRWHQNFPKGANVNFYEIIGEDLVYERTFERGVEDFTYACGTGTGSLVTVLTLQGKVSGSGVRVDMTGGTLIIDVEREGSAVRDLYLTGPTNIVAKGEVTDEDLLLSK
ncbi:MAG: diaminopimelate epimerase [Oscillibacter sp.]|nr:diaminopimelate epimerase [Oscillibacter sp.]